MSKILCLKLREDVYQETEKVIHKMRVSRNAYINSAVEFYNKLQKRALLKKELAHESRILRDNSMEVLKAFEALEDEISGP